MSAGVKVVGMDEAEIIKLNDIAQIFHQKGLDFEDSTNWEEAIKQYDLALFLRDSLSLMLNEASDEVAENALEGIIRALQNKSNCYYELQKWDDAEKTILNCIKRQKLIQGEWQFYWPLRMGRANRPVRTNT